MLKERLEPRVLEGPHIGRLQSTWLDYLHLGVQGMLRCLCCVINLLTLFHGSVNHSKHTLAQSAEVNIDCLTLLDITTDGITALLRIIIIQ